MECRYKINGPIKGTPEFVEMEDFTRIQADTRFTSSGGTVKIKKYCCPVNFFCDVKKVYRTAILKKLSSEDLTIRKAPVGGHTCITAGE